MPKYDWSNGPAELEPHSLAKHTILREYIEQYVSILTRSGTVPNLRLALIDGFAGGGEYVVKGRGATLHEGSPLILINAIRAAEARINAKRKQPISVDADFFFIEKERTAYDYLESTLAKRFERRFLTEKVTRIHGAFENHIEPIIETLRSTRGRTPRPIFVLDQYGYSDIPISTRCGAGWLARRRLESAARSQTGATGLQWRGTGQRGCGCRSRSVPNRMGSPCAGTPAAGRQSLTRDLAPGAWGTAITLAASTRPGRPSAEASHSWSGAIVAPGRGRILWPL